MRILHVLTTLDVGGAEMHVLAQVRGQTRRGHEVRVLWLKGRGSLAGDFREAGARVVERAGPFQLGALARHARWAEIVHSHLLKADLVAALVATLAGRRRGLVASKHNDEQVLKRPLVSWVHGLVGALPRRTIVLSDHVGAFVERHGRIPRSRQTRIYYGLDPGPFERAAAGAGERRDALRGELGLGRDDVVFVCVARFAPQKAHDVLLRAFRRALDRRGPSDPGLALLLVGDDPFGRGRERAQDLARELGLERAAVFTGIRRDVPDLVAAADVFVMSSLWEGLGLVFLEAMAASRPVLSTRVSAVPEVVVEGETGLLVPPAQVEPLAEGLLALARDGALRRRLGEAGHARVLERFGLERMIEETLEVYAQVLRGEETGSTGAGAGSRHGAADFRPAAAADDKQPPRAMSALPEQHAGGRPATPTGAMPQGEAVPAPGSAAGAPYRGPDRRRRPTPRFSRYSFFGGRRRTVRRKEELEGSFVDQYSPRMWALLAWIGLMNVGDSFFTLLHLQTGGIELNPFAALLLESGRTGFVVLKSLLIGVPLLVLCLHKNFQLARLGLWIAAGSYTVLFVYHLSLL